MIEKNTVGMLEMHFEHLRKVQKQVEGLAITEEDKKRINDDLENCVFTLLAKQLMEVAKN